MTENVDYPDNLDIQDRIYLEKLRLAVEVILRMGEDPGGLSAALESELVLFRDRVDRALLLKPGPAKPTV